MRRGPGGFEKDFPDVRWSYFRSGPRNWLERSIRFVNLGRTRCAWEATRAAKNVNAKLLISQESRLTFRCAAMAKLNGCRAPHIAWPFNFAGLPQGACSRTHAIGVQGRRSVHGVLGVRAAALWRLFRHPGVQVRAHPVGGGGSGNHVAGRPSRPGQLHLAPSAATLAITRRCWPPCRSSRRSRWCWWCGPATSWGLERPPNVTVLVDVPVGVANNVIHHSRFMVLPLNDSATANGHVTLVNAMKMGRGERGHDFGRGCRLCPRRDRLPVVRARVRQLDGSSKFARSGRIRNSPGASAGAGRDFAGRHCQESAMRGARRADPSRIRPPRSEIDDREPAMTTRPFETTVGRLVLVACVPLCGDCGGSGLRGAREAGASGPGRPDREGRTLRGRMRGTWRRSAGSSASKSGSIATNPSSPSSP